MTSTHSATSTVDVWYRKLAGHGLLYAERRLLDQGQIGSVLDKVRRRVRWSGLAHVVVAGALVPLLATRLQQALSEGGANRWVAVLIDGVYFTFWALSARRRLRAGRTLRALRQRLDAGTLTADEVLRTLDAGQP